MIAETRTHIIAAVGLAMMLTGIALIHLPTALIVFGLLMLSAAGHRIRHPRKPLSESKACSANYKEKTQPESKPH